MLLRIILSAVFGVVMTIPAQAQMSVCNKTSSPITLAVAYEADENVVSQGWWDVSAANCVTVIDTPLNRPDYYYYASSKVMNVEWAGSFNLCTSNESQFRIEGATGCEGRNLRTIGFRQLNVGTRTKGTLDISIDEPAPHSEAAAPMPTSAIPAPASSK